MIIVLILVALLLLLAVILMFNSVIYRKNQVNNAFAGIDVMLKQRYDLIPALTNCVKAYMSHEKELLNDITLLRTSYMEQEAQNEKVMISDRIGKQMNEFFINVENYPDLKAGENFIKLQAAWTEMEDHIAASRRFYNTSVNDYHNIIEMFPTNILAKMMGMKHRQYFSMEEA